MCWWLFVVGISRRRPAPRRHGLIHRLSHLGPTQDRGHTRYPPRWNGQIVQTLSIQRGGFLVPAKERSRRRDPRTSFVLIRLGGDKDGTESRQG